MPDIFALFIANPFWGWLCVGAVLLVLEAVTGTGWLLWPAVSAGLVGVLVLTRAAPSPGVQTGVFAAATLVGILAAKPWLRGARRADLNDRGRRLVGERGEVREAFKSGRGRVFVDGAEWAAELEGGGELAVGAQVKVVVVEGARLVVARA